MHFKPNLSYFWYLFTSTTHSKCVPKFMNWAKLDLWCVSYEPKLYQLFLAWDMTSAVRATCDPKKMENGAMSAGYVVEFRQLNEL